MKTAIYPGSFDPITLGHLNIIRRASGIFERVVVCIMPNAGKLHPMFTREERVTLARRVVSRFPNVEVDTFDGLLAEYAKTFPEGAVIVKGLRANTDFENEFQMALINKKINPELDTMVSDGQSEIYVPQLVGRQGACGLRRGSDAVFAVRDH